MLKTSNKYLQNCMCNTGHMWNHDLCKLSITVWSANRPWTVWLFLKAGDSRTIALPQNFFHHNFYISLFFIFFFCFFLFFGLESHDTHHVQYFLGGKMDHSVQNNLRTLATLYIASCIYKRSPLNSQFRLCVTLENRTPVTTNNWS